MSWQPYDRSLTLPDYCRDWLLKPYILTQHLRATDKSLTVKKVSQTQTNTYWQRQVCHQLDGEAVVFAQVDVPIETFHALEKQLGCLADQPLGETLLYGSAAVTRSPFEYAPLTPEDPMFVALTQHITTNEKMLWARRSTFYWHGLPLTVTEVFLPTIPPFTPIRAWRKTMAAAQNKLIDYIHLVRLHKPLPILLMLWPTLWGLWIASNGMPSITLLVIFIIGTFVMRSAGDIFNDLADRKFDGFIERTRMRPLATGRISVKNAVTLAVALVLIAFVLVLLLNGMTIVFAAIGLALALVYPLMKRITNWPQLVLGFAYNWGIILAFTAVQDRVPPLLAWCLLLIAVAWTIAYDTMYALADLKDDQQSGLKSTARLFGSQAPLIIGLFQAITLIGLATVGWILHFDWLYYLAVVLCVPFFVYQQSLLPGNQIKRCIAAFSNNHWVGLLIFVGVLVQYV